MEITPDFAIAIVAALGVSSVAFLVTGLAGLVQWLIKKGRKNE